MNEQSHILYIHSGSNLGNRLANLAQANQMIETQIGPIIQSSAIYETAAWGLENQDAFLNQAIEVHCLLLPSEVLDKLQAIEIKMGRLRKERWGPRLIDLDVLAYDDYIIHEDEHLIIPHPRLHIRNFVLAPFCEIAPDWKHPIFQMTTRELWGWCPDNLSIELI